MPQIKMRGIETEIIRKLSKQLIDELTVLTQSPRDDFTLEVIHSTFIMDGNVSQAILSSRSLGLTVDKRFKTKWLKPLAGYSTKLVALGGMKNV